MTHRGRLLAALHREIPDQVPVTWELEHRAAHALTGSSGWKAMCDAHRMVGSAIFNLQGVGPKLTYRMGLGYNEEAEWRLNEDGTREHTRTLTTPRGKLVERWRLGHLKDDPMLGVAVEHFVKDPDDYELLADFAENAARNAVPDLTACTEACDYIGDDGLVGFWMSDSMGHIAHARPAETFVMDLIDIGVTVTVPGASVGVAVAAAPPAIV